MGDNILNYQPTTAAARSVDFLVDRIDSAHLQWDTYGAALSLAYKKAFERHQKALAEVEANYKTNSSSLFYYLFAAFVTGAAGGLVGVLIAPVLEKAGAFIAARMIARSNSKVESMRIAYAEKLIPQHIKLRSLEAAEKAIKATRRVDKVTKAGQAILTDANKNVGKKLAERAEIELVLSKFFSPEPAPPEGEGMFKPPSTDPHQFDLQKRVQIGVCASLLKENVRSFQMLLDALGAAQVNELEKMARSFADAHMNESFLSDQPNSTEIAVAAGAKAQSVAEIAMWIAWANARDTESWATRLKGAQHVDRGIDYVDYVELKRLDPIFDRLMVLRVAHLAAMSFTVSRDFAHLTNAYQGQVLSIPLLQKLGSKHPNPFFRRIKPIVSRGRTNLKELEDIGKRGIPGL